jgi:hypothetical protein
MWGHLSMLVMSLSSLLLHQETHAFTIPSPLFDTQHQSVVCKTPANRIPSRLFIIAPPGSGYFRPEDEKSELPDTYEPMMEYPGTMRPGRTPENMPFHDLPIGDDDPEPVPWPHFQQIEWHHRWDPPHPHPVPMDEFIEQLGRWATPEQEAEMRTSTRRASRKRREAAEEKKRESAPLIMDDDEDDETDILPQDLGEGIFGKLGSTDDEKITAEAVSPNRPRDEEEEEDEDLEDDAGLDDFLLDLGLDTLGDEEDDSAEDDEDIYEDFIKPVVKKAVPKASTQISSLEDVVISGDDDEEIVVEDANLDPDVTPSIDVDDDDDMDLGLDDEDELEDSMEVPLDDFGENDMMDADDFFDDGGFDYDDDFDGGGDFDGGFD